MTETSAGLSESPQSGYPIHWAKNNRLTTWCIMRWASGYLRFMNQRIMDHEEGTYEVDWSGVDDAGNPTPSGTCNIHLNACELIRNQKVTVIR